MTIFLVDEVYAPHNPEVSTSPKYRYTLISDNQSLVFTVETENILGSKLAGETTKRYFRYERASLLGDAFISEPIVQKAGNIETKIANAQFIVGNELEYTISMTSYRNFMAS